MGRAGAQASALALLTGVLLLPVLGGRSARAADPAEKDRITRAQTLLARLQAARDAGELDRVKLCIGALRPLHNEMRTPAWRRRLQAEAGAILRDERLGSARTAAAYELARMNDPKGAWAQLKRSLPETKTEAVGPVGLGVIDAVGYLAPDAAVRPLIRFMERSRDPNAVVRAIQALGQFQYAKGRVDVLEALIDRARRLKPGGSKGGARTGAEARALWQLVHPAITRALNSLTGQQVADIEAWFVLYDENRKRPAALFKRDR